MSEPAAINTVTIEGLMEAGNKIHMAGIQILGITSGMASGYDTSGKQHGGEIVADQPSIAESCDIIATALQLFAEAKSVMTGIDGNGSAANDDAAAAIRMAVQRTAIATRIDDIRSYLGTHMRGLRTACPGASGESIQASLRTLEIDAPQRQLAAPAR